MSTTVCATVERGDGNFSLSAVATATARVFDSQRSSQSTFAGLRFVSPFCVLIYECGVSCVGNSGG